MNILKDLRTKRSVYQRDVAEYLGVDRTTYVKYENGDSMLSPDVLLKLSEYFNVSVDYILGHKPYYNSGHDCFGLSSLGQTVKFLRYIKGCSVTYLSKKTGISMQRIRDIEDLDGIDITDEELYQIAQALDATQDMIKKRYIPCEMIPSDFDSPERMKYSTPLAYLNSVGQKKALEYVQDLSDNPKYVKADKYTKADVSPADYFEIAAKGGTIMQSPKKKNETTL